MAYVGKKAILMGINYQDIYDRVFAICEKNGFSGFDPFDGLNSRIFQATPFRHLSIARLVTLQLVKRSPLNLRGILQVDQGVNPKGLALIALAEISRHRESGDSKHSDNVSSLLEMLLDCSIDVDSDGVASGAQLAWGYNFDWQSRAFFAPKGTPTIVPTAFAAFAFADAYERYNNVDHLETAESVGRFITGCLNRPHESDSEVCFSYTPVDNHVIYNASLLAGEVLARVGNLTGNGECIELGEKAARFVINRQDGDGSWAYGPKLRHSWRDNFHTAFLLSSLFRMCEYYPSIDIEVIDRGLDFWIENFFLEDGTPKYFDNKTYPVDIHAAAAAIITLCELAPHNGKLIELAENVAEWVQNNMWDERGYFYYQVHRFYRTKTMFMRWNNAWMALALARLIEVQQDRTVSVGE